MTPETPIRIIKKYPNRRLYDTEVSRYITLDEVRQLVMESVKFRVQDKNTHEDITRTILLQVIAEQEEGGNPIFTTELLTRVIRFYGDPMQASITRYLELSTQLFVQKQLQFSEQIKQLIGSNQSPVQVLNDLAEQNVPIWRSVRREFLRNLSRAKSTLRSRRRGPNDTGSTPASGTDDT
ncbi:MAG TPA: polyhydroxyalkanoate synthesis repressor PhaR [Verrucomicrobiae bacterium]|nr:polyhydroxyalkanoate synthesis repressor PhaR [Verrucomicrobiae bacterium]